MQLNGELVAAFSSIRGTVHHRDLRADTQSSPFPHSYQPVAVSLSQVATNERGKGKTALTSWVLTMPLTYFPKTESTQRTLDSTARHKSLSPTLTSIFLSPPLSLVCSPGSLKPVSARERATWKGSSIGR